MSWEFAGVMKFAKSLGFEFSARDEYPYVVIKYPTDLDPMELRTADVEGFARAFANLLGSRFQNEIYEMIERESGKPIREMAGPRPEIKVYRPERSD